MNTNLIEAFLAIVDTQSITKASEKLYVSQSTLTHRLNALEKELGLRLINRSQGQRYITLTAKGEEFLSIANRWISLDSDTKSWKVSESRISLNVALVDSLASYVFPPLFKEITENNSTIELKISSHWSVTIFDLLEYSEVDIGIVSRMVKSDSLITTPIFTEEMVHVSNSIYSEFNEIVSPCELDVKKELLLDWGNEFQVWHDYWWDPKENIQLRVDTAALIISCLNIPGSWAIVPLSVANSFKNIYPIQISKIRTPPPDRVCFLTKNRFPRPNKMDALNIFENYLFHFISQNPYLKRI